jgi:hypothetical protein
MNKIDENSDFLTNALILLQSMPYYKLNCIELAAEADCKQFIALPSVQNLTNDIWNGRVVHLGGIKDDLKVYLHHFPLKVLVTNFSLV